MKTPFTLDRFVEEASDCAEGVLHLRFKGAMPPKILENLQRLRRLGLLEDDVVLALIGQAPLDPIGLYGAMKHSGVWAFQAFDFTMIQVLAKKGNTPAALMRIDLISDEVTFVVLREGQLVEYARIAPDDIVAKFKEEGATEARFLAWLQTYINDAVAVGLGRQ